jgi:Rieske Fe-S protein
MSRPPSDTESHVDRRTVLGSLLHGTCALAALCAGCGPEWREATVLPSSDAEACGITPGRPEEGWVEVKLTDHPALRTRGGSAVVRVPESLLDVVVMHTASGCFAAVWHICTHGDCHVTYVPGEAVLECPCHGSRFAEDGRVLRGPATRPLQSFRVAREGDSLWVHRPL